MDWNMSILRKKAADHKGPIKHGTNETEKKSYVHLFLVVMKQHRGLKGAEPHQLTKQPKYRAVENE